MESIPKRSPLHSGIALALTACLLLFLTSSNEALAGALGAETSVVCKAESKAKQSQQDKSTKKYEKQQDDGMPEATSEEPRADESILENVNSIYVVDYDKVCQSNSKDHVHPLL